MGQAPRELGLAKFGYAAWKAVLAGLGGGPLPTETTLSGTNESYLTTPGHISKQARAGRLKTIWHPINC